MYYTNGNYSMGGNFKIKKQAPMDDRSTVAKKIDLQNPNLFDGFTYNGMIVSVVDDTINNGIYRLEDKTTKTWVKEGSSSGSVAFATEEEVITGTIVDKAISPLRLKANNYNKTEVDTKISNLILQNTGYNVFELPDFKLGEETKTAERWTDGKPIWRKVIKVTGMPVGTKDVAHNITGFSDLWIDHSKSFMYWGGGFGSASITRSSGTATKVDSEVILITNRTTVRLSSVYNFSDAVITICICFTKANEDITTPVAQVPVILEGLSEIPSPKLGVETKTAMRHPVSGKPIYTKTIDFGSLPNATTKSVNHNITNVEWINIEKDSSYVIVSNNPIDVRPISFISTSSLNNVWMTYITRTTISIVTGADRTSFTAMVTIRYTKTTDTAESPVRLVGGINPNEDIELSAGKGVIMTSANGTKYKLHIDNDGVITTEVV